MAREKKILAIDWGEKRVGLAIAEGGLAEPFGIIEVLDKTSVLDRIARICQQEEVQEIVLGLPLDGGGHLGPQAQKTKTFGQELARVTGRKVVFWNEALTSQEALAKMVEAGRPQRKRRRLDDIAATIILQEYLDSNR